jgi:hypothetical protein
LQSEITLPGGVTIPGPLKETYDHTQKAAIAMAVPDQSTSLAELIAALGSAPEDPKKQNGDPDKDSKKSDTSDMDQQPSVEDAEIYDGTDPFGDFSEYEEIRGVPPPNKTGKDILAEEIRNQENRKEKRAGSYKKVEKDW